MFKLYLDPGHGGSDPGAVSNGIEEEDITLTLGLKIRAILAEEYEDVAVKMSRTTDVYPSLTQRTNDANNWGADFFLSLHVNAGGGDGFESFIYPGSGSPTTTYQNIIHQEIAKIDELDDRGTKSKDLHVLRQSNMPALLTENGFIDNAGDASKMKQTAWIDNVARGHVNGLEKAFKIKKKVVAQVTVNNNQPSNWAKKDWEEATSMGLTDGSRPLDMITRQEAVVIVNRLRHNLLALINK